MSQATTWGMQASGPADAVAVASRINESLNALRSSHSGAAAPAYAIEGTTWLDTSDANMRSLKVRDGATGDHLMHAFGTAGDTLASAATVNLARSNGVHVKISGTTAITSFGTAPLHVFRTVVFLASLTLTNGASLILPGGQNIVTQAGDTALLVSEGAGVWRCIDYRPALTPAFLALKSSDQGIANGSGVVTFAESFDIGNVFNGTSRFTAPTAGRYFISLGLTIYGGTSGEITASLRKNGSASDSIASVVTRSDALSRLAFVSVALPFDLAAGDFMDPYFALSGAAGSVFVRGSNSSYFAAHLIR